MSSPDDQLPALKILIIGPSGAGKSACHFPKHNVKIMELTKPLPVLTRYCDDEFDPASATATIGIDFKTKRLAVHGKPYRITLFDTAGQERFRTLSTSFYRGAHGVVLVYDITSRASYLSMERWFEEAENNTVENVALFLVGSKLDKAESGRAVSQEEGRQLAEAHGALFCEVSSKSRENVRRPFVELVDRIVSKPELLSAVKTGQSSGAVALSSSGGYGYGLSLCSC